MSKASGPRLDKVDNISSLASGADLVLAKFAIEIRNSVVPTHSIHHTQQGLVIDLVRMQLLISDLFIL